MKRILVIATLIFSATQLVAGTGWSSQKKTEEPTQGTSENNGEEGVPVAQSETLDPQFPDKTALDSNAAYDEDDIKIVKKVSDPSEQEQDTDSSLQNQNLSESVIFNDSKVDIEMPFLAKQVTDEQIAEVDQLLEEILEEDSKKNKENSEPSSGLDQSMLID